MSYQELPFTYGKKTLKQINEMTGMVEGDTVFNTDWGLIEIYSGTNWTNSQSIEMFFVKEVAGSSGNAQTFSKMPPVPGFGTTNARIACPIISGTNNDEQNGYAIMQVREGDGDFPDEAGLGVLSDSSSASVENRQIGFTIRGESNEGSEENVRLVVAFMGNWNAYVTPNTSNASDSALTAYQGYFTQISSTNAQSGMLDDSFAVQINTGNTGPIVEGGVLPLFPTSATTPPDRNIKIQIQHVEVA